MSAQPDPLFPALAAVPDGLYSADARRPWWDLRKYWGLGGWLEVYRDNRGRTNVMWTSDRNGHSLLADPATIITLSKAGAIIAYFESALSLHLVGSYADDYTGPRDPRAIATARRMQRWLCGEACS